MPGVSYRGAQITEAEARRLEDELLGGEHSRDALAAVKKIERATVGDPELDLTRGERIEILDALGRGGERLSQGLREFRKRLWDDTYEGW